MNVKTYSVKELRNLIKESLKEYKPILGTNVTRDNKKNNTKAYQDAEKYAKKSSSNMQESGNIPDDDNKGMENIEYDNINPQFQKRVKSQLKGYVSSDAEKLHQKDEFGNADFDEIKGLKDKSDKLKQGKDKVKKIGLTSREINPKDFEKQHKTVFQENKIPKVKFKKTIFISEGHMLSKVPDDFKTEGKKFYMQDKDGVEYLVEWNETPKVLPITHISNEKNKIQHLFEYKSSPSQTSSMTRQTENDRVKDILDKARKLK